jgi:plastocyanin
MRVVCMVWLVLAVSIASLPDAAAISKKKACRLGCKAAIDACVASGGKRARCKRLTLKTCRKQGIETCTVTTTTVAAPTTTTTVTTTTLPTTTTLLMLNGCTTADAEDRTKPTADRTVEFGPYYYAPHCIRIAAGQSVTFAPTEGSSFAGHPLVGGEISGGTKVPDPSSPIPSLVDGTIADVPFPSAGTFPYYCDQHGVLFGMEGVVFVDPAP